MFCFMCKSSLEDKPTTFMVEVENCIIIVKNVPSQVCSQCGETSYSDNVAAELEKIVSEARKDLMEIMVINYASRAA
ncbi:MAG: type II toxin-antitoxin system MqsA family antitoxin [Oscillospiraceae bacterium]|nr:type II toxin-antitoxin system MqsA family antitoxin [Oscillospiraceae bacterium]